MSPAAHTRPRDCQPAAETSAVPDSMAARLQAVEILVTETLATLLAANPALIREVSERSRRHATRLVAGAVDAGMAIELDRQMARMLRNIALRVGLDGLKG